MPSLKTAKSSQWPWARSVSNSCSVVSRGNWVCIKRAAPISLEQSEESSCLEETMFYFPCPGGSPALFS